MKPHQRPFFEHHPLSLAIGVLLGGALLAGGAQAQQASAAAEEDKQAQALPAVDVRDSADPASGFATDDVALGPLGRKKLQHAPYSVQVLDSDVIQNQQATSLTEVMRYLPSTQMEARGGMDIGRPQSRGMRGDVVATSHLDGLNIVSTTAFPLEMVERLEVINGLTGPLYGPASPAGQFNYTLKRPTQQPLRRVTLGWRSHSAISGHADLGGRAGPGGMLGYRINLLKEKGEAYVSGSDLNRTLYALSFDVRFSPDTVLELNASRYQFEKYGYPGSFSYGVNTRLPKAPDPTRQGYGQPYLGLETDTDTGSVHLRHRFSPAWRLEAGYGRQIADRYMRGQGNAVQADGQSYVASTSSSYPGRFTVNSNYVRLNGTVDSSIGQHELLLATTGYDWKIYSARVAATRYNLGRASFANPVLFPEPTAHWPREGGTRQSGRTRTQALTVGDTLHFHPQWSAMLLGSYAQLKSDTHKKNGFSGTASLSYKPLPELTSYIAYADTLQDGGVAGKDTANEGQVLAPVRSKQYELGLRYAPRQHLLLGATLFDTRRPFAFTGTDNYYRVQGQQRNRGLELFVQGELTPQWSLYGGVTLLNAKLTRTPHASTEGKYMVGVPKVQASLLAQYLVPQVPGLALTGNLRYTGKRYINTVNTATVDGYAILDLGARYTMRLGGLPATFRLSVNNVTNKKHWVSLFPGNVDGGVAAGSAFLGDPREVRASLTLSF